MSARFTLPSDARVALSIVVNLEEGAEQSVAAGDKHPEPVDELGVALRVPVRNFANESNYQYGIRAGAQRVFRVLANRGVTCTVTAASAALAQAPNVADMILAGGHEVCAHGYRWVHQFSFDEARERAFIRKAVETQIAAIGTRPSGWLSRYLFTEQTRRLLVEEGFLYHMDDYSDDIPRWEQVETAEGRRRIVVVPYALDTNDMKFWLAPGCTPAQWLDYAIATFDQLYAEGADRPAIMSLGVHLRIIGRPGRIGTFDRFLQHALSHKAVWTTSRLAIAQRFADLNPD
jgi:allantoinase